jgi:hypothetical protein
MELANSQALRLCDEADQMIGNADFFAVQFFNRRIPARRPSIASPCALANVPGDEVDLICEKQNFARCLRM